MLRRKFIHRWGRWTMLGGMLATAGYFAFSGRVSATSTCQSTGKCGECSRFTSCTDPERQKTLNHGK